MRDFKEISSDCFYKMGNYHQKTIDLIQETEELFNESPKNRDEENILIEKLGALSYEISTELEIFNPALEIEISDLKDILVHIEKKTSDLMAR